MCIKLNNIEKSGTYVNIKEHSFYFESPHTLSEVELAKMTILFCKPTFFAYILLK